jgi:CO/xanthine dehydrogenase FAD-binding subunit
MAGGTDILLWASHSGEPAELAWTVAVEELNEFRIDESPMRIGAAVTLARLLGDTGIRDRAPAVFDGAWSIGSVQIRNQASLMGNVCTASPAGDTLPGLLVHEAEIETVSVSGARRRQSLEDFLIAPGQNSLKTSELASAILIQPLAASESSAFRRYTVRRSLDLAFASAAIRLAFEADGRTVKRAWLALGAVGPCAMNAHEAAAELEGGTLAAASRLRCAEAAAEYCSPISDHRASAGYRRQLIRVLVEDVVGMARRRAGAPR